MSAYAVAGSDPEIALATSSVISVQNLVHRYGDRTALNGVSFDVRPAELFGLLGPNGSGKTTLFRILSTLMIPVAGRALILGFDSPREPIVLGRHLGASSRPKCFTFSPPQPRNLRHLGIIFGCNDVPRKY